MSTAKHPCSTEIQSSSIKFSVLKQQQDGLTPSSQQKAAHKMHGKLVAQLGVTPTTTSHVAGINAMMSGQISSEACFHSSFDGQEFKTHVGPMLVILEL